MVQNWFFHFLIPLNISVVIVRISALKKWVHGYSHAYLLAISLKKQGIFGNINANLIVSMLKLLQVSMWSKQPQSPCCHSASAIIAGKSNHNDQPWYHATGNTELSKYWVFSICWQTEMFTWPQGKASNWLLDNQQKINFAFLQSIIFFHPRQFQSRLWSDIKIAV